MRQLRILKQGVWYEIRTRVNNREPLFRGHKAPAIFARVFRETELRFVFEIRGLRLEDDWLTFYIRPEDGLELPAIMKWMKQTFAVRYNRAEGRIGHIWGDRYWSGIVEGEPPEAEGTGGPAADTGVRPHGEENHRDPGFSLISPLPTTPAPV
ncbi:MAG: transposase [Treponema sp.]|jgi:REP element-mobilizing transposase RayT|nr:transposase [Treponema sp.]